MRRFIRLTELQPELRQMVDEGKISLTPAVEPDCTGTVLEKPVVTPEPTTIPEPEETSDESSASPMLMVLSVLVLGAGGAVYYLKFRKAKPDAKGTVDLDDFDFADADEDDTEYVSEDEHSENSKDSDKA